MTAFEHWPDLDDVGYEFHRESLLEVWPALVTEPVVHWQHPGRDRTAVCHGRKTTAPLTRDRTRVTCGTCRQSRTWKAAA